MKEERKVRKEAEKSRVEEKTSSMLKNIDNAFDRIGASANAREECKKFSLEAVKEYANAKM